MLGPVVWRTVCGLEIGINQLALVLLTREATGSFAAAGVVVGALTLAAALTAPLLGRTMDRIGQTRVMVPCAVLNALALVGFTVAALEGAGLGVLIGLAVLAGGTPPPVNAAVRELLPRLAGAEGVGAAFALEAVLIEVFFIGGPLIAAGIIVIASPAAAVLVSAGMVLVGGVGFALTGASRAWRPEPAGERHRLGALRSPGIRVLALWGVPFGAGFGVLEVALPAFGTERGSPAAGGVLLAALALGSLAGGLAWGPSAAGGRTVRRFGLLSLLLAAGYATFPLAESVLLLGLLCAVASLPLAPLGAISFALIERTAPEGARQEAYTWLQTAQVGGVALGAVVAGALVEGAGTRWALGAAAVALGLCALVALAGRSALGGAGRIPSSP